jgi:phosphoglycolate phosphatase-like HAD superfamily hydrolase
VIYSFELIPTFTNFVFVCVGGFSGGDAGSKPKPDPHNALMICRKLGVAPDNAVMVGDTRADTEMGKSAGLGLTVGALHDMT